MAPLTLKGLAFGYFDLPYEPFYTGPLLLITTLPVIFIFKNHFVALDILALMINGFNKKLN